MGGNFSYRIYKDAPQKDIEAQWADDVQQSLYESGHMYSGAIGMLGTSIAAWHDKEFATQDEADDFLSGIHNKWEPGEAVSFWEEVKEIDEAKREAQEKRLAEIDSQISALYKAARPHTGGYLISRQRINELNAERDKVRKMDITTGNTIRIKCWMIGGWCSS